MGACDAWRGTARHGGDGGGEGPYTLHPPHIRPSTAPPTTYTLHTHIRPSTAPPQDALAARVMGQPGALRAVCNALLLHRLGLGDPSRPVSFLFASPTPGVGRTTLCKVGPALPAGVRRADPGWGGMYCMCVCSAVAEGAACCGRYVKVVHVGMEALLGLLQPADPQPSPIHPVTLAPPTP